MFVRRPRVNVKPNVQTARPVSNSTVQSQETSVEVVPIPPSSQEEQSTPQNEIPVEPPPSINKELVSDVEEITETPPSVQISFQAPPSPPALTSVPPTRTLFRRKIVPNFGGVKGTIHHRRPSASCSGTESETESSRQKHSTASSITYGRITQPFSKSIITNESQINTTSDIPVNGETSTLTKSEAIINEITDIRSTINDHSLSQISSLSTRTNRKISREYLTQHITYRAQRLASKVEPDMTIRKRRAATLEKLDETGVNKGGPVDTSKLKIADFVHYNPSENPMEAKIKSATIITTDPSLNPVRKHSISSTDGQNSNVAPQLKINANGELALDEESLIIRNTDDTYRPTVIVEGQFNDDNLTHQSYRKIGRRKRWNNRDTLRFYQALRMCGTDFTLIARVFPNRDRDDIKRKFKTEDKANRTLVDSALSQRIPFDLTCFYSPSEDSTDDENGSDMENVTQKKSRKRRLIKRKSKHTSSDPLEINRRREKRLQAKKNSMRVKKSAEFINDDDDEDESSMDVADTVEVTTTTTAQIESKSEQVIPSNQNEENLMDNALTNMADLENLLGRIDGSHLLFVHNTDEATGLDRIDVHVVMPNTTDNNNTEQTI